jgi:hypothetical protein
MLVVLLALAAVAAVRLSTPDAPPDPRPLWDRVLASLVGLLQCFGLVIGASFLVASVEVLKQAHSRYQLRQVEKKLSHLQQLARAGRAPATAAGLARVVRLLRDGDEAVRREALRAAFALLRAAPGLATPASRDELGRALLAAPGFARALAETPAEDDLLARVTLGAKLGAGTAEKRLAPPTSDPNQLAAWVERHRRGESNPELQLSIGYDTGALPGLEERGRFLALYLFISTTDLQRFQGLLHRPPRDPNAAYGLLIRGDVVEVRSPGQARGHRLDFVFPLPVRLSTPNLAGLFRQMQLLSLGLLVGCVEGSCRALLGEDCPPWLGPRRQAVARAYTDFERRLVRLLRRYDHHRDPRRVHPLLPADHAERVRALLAYRLEECLYPQYRWVVPLYDPDTSWDQLLAPLRAVEAMLLHQGEVEGSDVTRGLDLIQHVRQLGHDTAWAIEQALTASYEAAATAPLPHDPFIDPAEEAATRHYLAQVGAAIARGETTLEDLPDPALFRRACAYYQIELGQPAEAREVSPEPPP